MAFVVYTQKSLTFSTLPPRRKSMRQAYADKIRAQGPSPHKPSGTLKRSRLARQSQKAKERVPDRLACCAAVRERSGGRCETRIEGVCTGAMAHTHEIKSRSAGGSITDPSNCLATCVPWPFLRA